MIETLDNIIQNIENLQDNKIIGFVIGINGLFIEGEGIENFLSIGSHCIIESKKQKFFLSEVVKIDRSKFILMSFNKTDSVTLGCKIIFIKGGNDIYPHESWLGRVINALALPIDNKGSLKKGSRPYCITQEPPPAHQRAVLKEKLDLGVKSINTFITCSKGQRMGIFAGSGVGKSMLISMLTRFASVDIKIIGLIGERSREVKEFIEFNLGQEGLKNTIMVVSTSNESPMMRKRAAYTMLTIAEYFRDLGKNVLCLMDSITRFATAQREIGLLCGEPPTTKGHTPSVFSELPMLLERAGPGLDNGSGSITGLFTVLVDGEDMNDPIADSVRSILDGHIILERKIAERGRFPAINVVKSVSRTMSACTTPEEKRLNKEARQIMSTYAEMEELILLGVYKKGSDPNIDKAILYNKKLEEFLHQDYNSKISLSEGHKMLKKILM